MKTVKAKKHLGQHFLEDSDIARRIVAAFNKDRSFKYALEIGPGMGVLTEYLTEREDFKFSVIEIDNESTQYLKKKNWLLDEQIINDDFLQYDLSQIFGKRLFAVIGNFPYNISSQILFKILDNKEQIVEVVGMFQKEVAERISSKSGSKSYGITSVLLQAFYDIEYLFTVHETAFRPKPKVKSAIVRLKRNQVRKLDCDEKLFKTIVKTSFNQRRKTLRNSLKPLLNDSLKKDSIFDQRPEQLNIKDFVILTKQISDSQ